MSTPKSAADNACSPDSRVALSVSPSLPTPPQLHTANADSSAAQEDLLVGLLDSLPILTTLLSVRRRPKGQAVEHRRKRKTDLAANQGDARGAKCWRGAVRAAPRPQCVVSQIRQYRHVGDPSAIAQQPHGSNFAISMHSPQPDAGPPGPQPDPCAGCGITANAAATTKLTAAILQSRSAARRLQTTDLNMTASQEEVLAVEPCCECQIPST